MSESDGEYIKLSCGETLKMESGGYRKFEAEFCAFQRPDESVKECFIRTKKVVDAMSKVMLIKIQRGFS